MLELLKKEANKTYTENGAVTYISTMSDCLDLFATIGAMRKASDNEIINRFIKAFAENPDYAIKILFYARDIRGGLGERKLFKTVLRYLAENEPEVVEKNMKYIQEYGRFDDLLVLIDSPCEDKLIDYYREQLDKDVKAANEGKEISLLAKWMPSINTSDADRVALAKRLARKMGYSAASYRKTLSFLREQIKIIENNMRMKDYSFEYERQTSKSLYKYRQAFIRNDAKRYREFLDRSAEDHSVMHTGTLTPYEVVAPIVDVNNRTKKFTKDERNALDVTWNALENYVGSENAIAVVDGSGSMYWDGKPSPAAVAQSLGIYFAEHNTGVFKNHFITFSSRPQLVKIKGKDIVDKMNYCMSFNECSNTNIEATFDLILKTAVKNKLKQEELPTKLYIISDMEFDQCAENSTLTNMENAKRKFESKGYILPQIVFWNVSSRNRQQPVKMDEKGVILVSGCTPQVFSMVKEDCLDPYHFMIEVISSKRYEKIAI
ncbi:MAG: DUF2828 family protein [Lachnospiraceae bacterium]|nr:DUF2828 family protein [Lachnospiraceae bacterium]